MMSNFPVKIVSLILVISIFGVFMKNIFSLIIISILLAGCAPKIGSEEWCNDMKEKPKGDWTATQTKDFTKHCIF